ncbi:family 10 glycosylhydrolase [Deinococcus sp. YIM 134068]|uniref:family 10 glycosylhydrolase n=1 Tax=Deinococcus lichenicola TaxID=3118910 RepID=UPI002F935A75
MRRPLLAAALYLSVIGLSVTACVQGQPQSAQSTGRLAFWLRPPATAAELRTTLNAARQAGFTDVLLEGFYHGRVAWASDQFPRKLDYDAVQTALDVQAQGGPRVNVWVETLYWRPAASFGIPVTPLWKDSLATLTADGRPSLSVSKLGFVDPAAPEVRDTLARLVTELATRYPEAGLHLDYLRYPRETDFGYHPAALAGFRAQTGLDARTLPRAGEDGPGNGWRQWVAYRQNLTTTLAGNLIRTYRDSGGRSLVSAAVYGMSDPLQNWRAWSGLEAAMPMLYLPGNLLTRLALLQFPRGEGVWPGVQVGPRYPALADQLRTVRAAGYSNVAVFGWTPGGSDFSRRGVRWGAARGSRQGFRRLQNREPYSIWCAGKPLPHRVLAYGRPVVAHLHGRPGTPHQEVGPRTRLIRWWTGASLPGGAGRAGVS